MEQDQAKHHLKEHRVEKGGLETTDSSLTPLLAVCGQGWPSQTQTPPLTIYLLSHPLHFASSAAQNTKYGSQLTVPFAFYLTALIFIHSNHHQPVQI